MLDVINGEYVILLNISSRYCFKNINGYCRDFAHIYFVVFLYISRSIIMNSIIGTLYVNIIFLLINLFIIIISITLLHSPYGK